MISETNCVTSQKQKYYWLFILLITAFVILALPALAHGTSRVLSSDSLPYNCVRSNDTIYISGTKISSSGHGINLGDYDNILIALDGDTLEFGTANAGAAYGIQASWGANNIHVRGGMLLHGIGETINDTGTGSRCMLMRTNGNGFHFENVNMTIKGKNGKCLDIEGNPKNIEVDGGILTSKVHSFTSRCYYDAAVIDLESESSVSGTDYHLLVHDAYLSGPHVCINVSGQDDDRPLVYIYGNTLLSDARNDMYLEPDGNSCHSCGNPFVINTWRIAAGSEIHDNIILSGTEYAGGYGFILQGLRGTETDSIKIYNNEFNIHHGPGSLDGVESGCRGIYMRALIEEGRTDLYNTYVHIFNNDIKIYVDALASTGHTGNIGEGARIALGGGTDHILFEKNRIQVIRSDSLYPDTGIVETCAISVGKPDSIDMDYTTTQSDHIFRHNYYRGYKTPIWMGVIAIHELTANNITFYEDTIVCLSDYVSHTAIEFTRIGTYSDHSTGNRLLDCVFQGYANDDDVVFNTLTYSIDSCLGKDVRFQRTAEIHVRGADLAPMENATVWIENNYGQTVAFGQTDAFGDFSDTLTYKYLAYDPAPDDGCDLVDSTAYNDFIFKASKNGDTATTVYTVSATSTFPLTLTLSAGGDVCETPPTIPAPSSPSNGFIVSARPTVCVNNSDGGECTEALTYHFQIAMSSNMSGIIAEQSGIDEGSGTTCFTPSFDLNQGQTYYWRARSFNGTVNSGWSAIRNFTIEEINSPPSSPLLASPANGSEVTTLTPNLTCNNSSDADGDALTYDFQVSTTSGFTNIVAQVSGLAEGASSTTSWTVDPQLTDATSYYWRVRAYDGADYSDWSSSRIFTVQLPNNPPAAPILASPSNGATVTTLDPSLTCNNSSDADGDALTYGFQVSTTSGFTNIVAQVSGLAEGTSSSTSWTVSPQLTDGSSYYWRVRAYDGADYSGWSSSRIFTVQLPNNPPTAPVLASPSNGASVNTLIPVLTCNNSFDADGNDLTYNFEVSSNSNFTAIVAQANGVTEGGGPTTSWTVNITLNNQTNYWWRVRAYDGEVYSNYSQTSLFYTDYSEPNDPPTPPMADEPPAGDTVDTPTPILTVSNSTDPEGDSLSYFFEVWNDQKSGLVVASPQVPEEDGGTTSWEVSTELDENTHYFWRSRSFDGNDYAPWMDWADFSTAAPNSAPSIPALYLPNDGDTMLGTAHTLVIYNSSDEDGDTLTYEIKLCSDPGMTDVVEYAVDIEEGDFATTSYLTTATMVDGQFYCWQARAFDGEDYSEWSGEYTFLHYEISVEAEEIPIALSPSEGEIVHSIRPKFKIQIEKSADGLNHYFELADNSEFYNPQSSGPIVGTSPHTFWVPEFDLQSNTEYYWRARSENSGWSEPISFTVAGKIHTAPNPYRPARDGEEIVFKNIPESSTIVIVTVTGNVVREIEGVYGPDVVWDGKNSEGQALASGVYLYYVTYKGGSASGKFAVLR
jgi:hypothetical protein